MTDLIIPRGIENKTAIGELPLLPVHIRPGVLKISDLVVKHIRMKLDEKSKKHSSDLQHLGRLALGEQLSQNVEMMAQTPQFVGMNTILQDPSTEQVDFVFYFDRLACMLIER